jgi:hypothetical protein
MTSVNKTLRSRWAKRWQERFRKSLTTSSLKRGIAYGTAAITACRQYLSLCTALTARSATILLCVCSAIRITPRTRTGLRSKKYRSTRAHLKTAPIYSQKHTCNVAHARKVYLSLASEFTSVRLALKTSPRETQYTGARNVRRQRNTSTSEPSLRRKLARNLVFSLKMKPSIILTTCLKTTTT